MTDNRLSTLFWAVDLVGQFVKLRLYPPKSATRARARQTAALNRKAEVLVAKLADPTSRRANQTELRHMGRPAVDPLIRALRDESLRPFAEVVLIELGRLAEPQLRSVALHGRASVRRAAQQTLNRMGES